jgi:hypothetical protein
MPTADRKQHNRLMRLAISEVEGIPIMDKMFTGLHWSLQMSFSGFSGVPVFQVFQVAAAGQPGFAAINSAVNR